MKLSELDAYLRDFLKIDAFPMDPSLNGVQVAGCYAKCSAQKPEMTERQAEPEIVKIAFAVDASLQTIRMAAEQKADMLFVHHGILWGRCERITGAFYERITALTKSNIVLYACHLPLDAHKECGNNYGMAKKLELKNCADFGAWRNTLIGVQGELDEPLTIDAITKKLFPLEKKIAPNVLSFGKEKIKRVAIISGGAGGELVQAIEAGADLYITGEIAHEQYHVAKEAGINVLGLGHYASETFGVQLMMAHLEKMSFEAVFLDAPTGL
ncbi:MAG: Nif3-like dinuclear metal center hexameric protein [Treponemataceae bacterium]|nr:MAG: Nif3-like dinuclear metal center hexameric protein [Treponemataceae bacterium]